MEPQKPSDNNRLPQEDDGNKLPPNPGTAEDASPPAQPARPGSVVVGGAAGQPETSENPAKPPAAAEPAAPADDTPDAASPAPAAMPATPSPSSKKKKKLTIAAVIVGVLLLLLGAGAAAYFAYYLPNKPENVLKSALVNSFSEDKAASAQFEGEVDVTEKASGDTIGVDLSGAVNQEGAFDLSMAIDAVLTTVTFDVRSVDGKTFYAKLGGLDGLPELLSAGNAENEALQPWIPLITEVNDQWYEINESLVRQLTGITPEDAMLTDEDRQKLAQAYDKHKFLSVTETLADEEINGTNSHHYKVTVDNAKLKSFMSEVQAADINAFALNQEVLDNFNTTVDETDFSKYPVDVWIAKDTKLFKQFAFSMQDDEATLDLRLTITDYNQPVEVEKPESARSILEVLSGIFNATEATLRDSSEATNGISL